MKPMIKTISPEEELRRAQEELKTLQSRIQNELEAAAVIQRSLLPVRSPLLKGLRASWLYQPSCHLGGDSLNIFRLNENHAGFYLLDVSGHGIAAALMSVAVSHFLSPFSSLSFLREGTANSVASPADVIGRLNQQFASHPEIRQFFTIVYGVINTATNELAYASAGHPPCIVLSESGERFLNSTGLPVGVDANAAYDMHLMQLRPGERLYLYSDGVVEAASEREGDFGEERLLKSLRASMALSLPESLDRLTESVRVWSGEDGLDDDVSLLALECA